MFLHHRHIWLQELQHQWISKEFLLPSRVFYFPCTCLLVVCASFQLLEIQGLLSLQDSLSSSPKVFNWSTLTLNPVSLIILVILWFHHFFHSPKTLFFFVRFISGWQPTWRCITAMYCFISLSLMGNIYSTYYWKPVAKQTDALYLQRFLFWFHLSLECYPRKSVSMKAVVNPHWSYPLSPTWFSTWRMESAETQLEISPGNLEALFMSCVFLQSTPAFRRLALSFFLEISWQHNKIFADCLVIFFDNISC